MTTLAPSLRASPSSLRASGKLSSERPVIASKVKQSSVNAFSGWIASPTATMLPQVRNDNPLPRHCERASRHCERSEAIQCEGLLRLDCFVASGNCRLLAMTPAQARNLFGPKPGRHRSLSLFRIRA
ncbi:MAG: hypothetical protein LBT00_11945 [Spirochaetaceae bacterium]|nr:hypothetical protein [Spirochaetaceae bacterium]